MPTTYTHTHGHTQTDGSLNAWRKSGFSHGSNYKRLNVQELQKK